MAFEGLLSVVVPVYRSEPYLDRTVRSLLEGLEPHGAVEIILVNDGSPDQVQTVIDQLVADEPRVRAIELGANRGQHVATLLGMAEAKGDWVATVDDDGQNPPTAILPLIEEAQRFDLDVVYGRFKATIQSPARALASRVNRWISKQTLGNTRGIAITNVRVIRGDLARALGATELPYPYIDAMIFRATREIGEVEVEHLARADGASTYRLDTLFKLWFSHLTSLTDLPLRVATYLSLSAALIGVLAGTVQLGRALIGGRAPAGWLSVYLSLTLLFSVAFAVLGVLSLYVGRMYVAQNSRGLTWTRPARRRGPDGRPLARAPVRVPEVAAPGRVRPWAARAATWLPAIFLFAYFAANADAQWLRLDDFILTHEFRKGPLGDLVTDIIFTRTTPHVRFAFLTHFLLMPLYRWFPGSQAVATTTFLVIVGALLVALGLLLRRLRMPPLLTLGAWLALAGGFLTVHAWQTYEFKAALYLILALGMVCLVTLYAGRLYGGVPTRRSNLGWVLLAILTVHSAEIGLVSVIVLGAVLVWHRKLAPLAYGASVTWPLAFWGLNRLLFPRESVVLQNVTRVDAVIRYFFGSLKTWTPEVTMAAAVTLLVSVVLFREWRTDKRPSLTGAIPFAFLGTALGLIVTCGIAYLWMGERHITVIRLSFTLTIITGIAYLITKVQAPVAKWALVLAMVIYGVPRFSSSARQLGPYLDERRVELRTTRELQRDVRAAAALESSRNGLVVLVKDWSGTPGGRLEPSFLGAPWSIMGFAWEFSCPGKAPCSNIDYVFDRAPVKAGEVGALCDRLKSSAVLLSSGSDRARTSDLVALDGVEDCGAFLSSHGFVAQDAGVTNG